MKIIYYFISTIISLSLILLFLLISIWMLCYAFPNYYRNEFKKYSTADNIGMDVEDLLIVNEQMLDYLIDKKDSLEDIKTTINGEENIAFFNEREVAHMKDVKVLFLKGLKLIYILTVSIIVLSILLFLRLKKKFLLYLANTNLLSLVFMFLLLLIFSILIFNNFTKYFIIFHNLFFNNDLWILNPQTDRLINIVPEIFFINITKNILKLYSIFISALLIFSLSIKGLYFLEKLKIKSDT